MSARRDRRAGGRPRPGQRPGPGVRTAVAALGALFGAPLAVDCGTEASPEDISAYDRPSETSAAFDRPGSAPATGAAEAARPPVTPLPPQPAEPGPEAASPARPATDAAEPAPGPDAGGADRSVERGAPRPPAEGGAGPPADELQEATTAGQPVDVDRLLAAADAAYAGLASLRARFHEVVDVVLLERRREGTGTWYQKGRSRFRMDYAEPPEHEIVADGTYLWLYYPSTHPGQVIRSRLDAGPAESGTADVLARILEEARTGYEARHTGSEPLAGVLTHLIDLRPTRRSPYRRVRVWIGVEDRLVRRFEITEESETVRTVTLSALEPNAPLPDSLFRFAPPPGTEVFEG